LDVEAFASCFGDRADCFTAEAREQISRSDFGYEALPPAERDQAILEVVRKLDEGNLQKAGEHRHQVWEQGWKENLDAFAADGLEALVPRFMRPSKIVRLNQDYVKVRNPRFELDFFAVLRMWLYRRYFSEATAVYEFGCGSGYNLLALARMYPTCELWGLDWAETAVDLVNRLGESQHLRLRGRRFDFFHPDRSLQLGPRSAVMTMAALEQVGPRHGEFVEFLLDQSPGLVLNVEPLLELYDPARLVDYLAIRYHKYRGYLDGYLSRLRQLQVEGRIEILQIQRPNFGSLFHEGYSIVAWRPLRS
jgi:SAM-dependent methyltransferase